jgi:predicted ATP-binding protein involved in virulence
LRGAPNQAIEGQLELNRNVASSQYAEALSTFFCIGYGAGRRLGSASFADGPTLDPIGTLISDTAELRNPEEWLLQLDYAVAKSGQNNPEQVRQLQTAKDLLLRILPEVEDIRLTSSAGVNPKGRAEFKTPYGWVPLRQLGYGYQTLITWVADLVNRMAERYPNSQNPLAEPAVVLVDEIDLHLHPLWQRQLMSFLSDRFPNTQFIATAHSPLMAQAAQDANLAVLRREGDHVVIDNDVDNIRGWRIDQILTSDLFGLETARPPQTAPLLLERKSILTKSNLTAEDKRRLAEIELAVGRLPTGESAQEVKEREAIQKSLDLLLKDRRKGQ